MITKGMFIVFRTETLDLFQDILNQFLKLDYFCYIFSGILKNMTQSLI